MEQSHVNTKKIAKNTALLYFRMLFMMAISLFTSRVVLNVLGFDNFGIYQVVGGIVIVLSFLNTSMASATQRFLNVALGKRDLEKLKKIFNTSQIIHISLAVIIVILAETIGVWFLNTQMTIPAGRTVAANWVFQFSVLSFVFSVISVPYNATIIAHEKMSAFAYISIIEAVLKLLIVYLLLIIKIDKLIVYAGLLALTSCIVRIIYSVYCNKNFEECKGMTFKVDKCIMKDMIGFSSWTIVGALGSISHTQGIAIVINMFFNVTVNAALGITNQVTNVINNFVINFMTAINPQIVKTYASGELKSMHDLVDKGSRIGIFLVSIFAVPLIIETPVILKLWLGKYPDYTVIFIRLVLITAICNAYAQPLATAQAATGNIKVYQIILTTLGLLHLPLAWASFELGGKAYWAMYIYLILINIMQGVRIWIVSKSIKMDMYKYITNVILRSLLTVVLSFALPLILHLYLPNELINSLLIIFVGVASTALFIYFVGITATERRQFNNIIKAKLQVLGITKAL